MASSRHRIIKLTETGSTNKDAMRLALAGEPLPLWICAERQSEGRGRAGRVWVSDAGNLQASLALTCQAPLQSAGQLSFVAGIALIEAVRAISPLAQSVGLRLKWPNDLLIGPAKAGGILVETTTARGEPTFHEGPTFQQGQGFLAIIGFGLNVTTCPPDLGRAATSLAANGIAVTPDTVLEALADHSEIWIKHWDNGRCFGDMRQAWLERAGAIGEAITVNAACGPVSGTYQGLAPDGALLVEVAGQIETFTYGDVALIAPSEESSGQ